MARTTTGIRVRHARGCASRDGGACKCTPSYEAFVYLARERRKVRKTFPTLAAAKGWRANATVAAGRGDLRAPSQMTLREAADAWIEGAKAGTVRAKGGAAYKPSTLRGYEQALRDHVLPRLVAARLADIRRGDLQDVADRLLADGRDASTIRNAIAPLRAIYRRAVTRGDVAVNPTAGLELPAPKGKRDRVAEPAEAAALLEALGVDDRPVWAAAMYAGLRRD